MPGVLEIPSERARDYDDVRYHAAGAEAEVYTAVYVSTGQRVALKVLIPRPGAAASRERREKRFLQEASLLREAGGAHVARVYEVLDVRLRGEPTKAFSMEWLPETFRDLVGRHPDGLPLDDLERYLREAVEGLQALHGNSVAARDVRPENLLLSARGALKVADLGMARTDDGAASLVESSRYMAPEVLDGTIRAEYASDDPPASAYFPSDVYGLGVIFYEAAVGAERWEELPTLRSVFGVEGPGSGLDRNQRWREWHLDREKRLPPVGERRKDLPGALGRVLDGMAEKAREHRMPLGDVSDSLGGKRPPALAQKRDDLGGVQRKSRERGRPKWVYAASALGLGLIVVAALALWPRPGSVERIEARPSVQEPAKVNKPVDPAMNALPPPIETKTVSLKIESEPSGAEIRIDGLLRGTSPAEIKDLDDGKRYKVRLRKRGYVEWVSEVKPGPTLRSLKIELEESKVSPKHEGERLPVSPSSLPTLAEPVEPSAVASDGVAPVPAVANKAADPATMPPAREPQSAPRSEMVLIPSGNFQMGSEDGDRNAKPVHAVRISKSYYLDKHEVTNAQYATFLNAKKPEATQATRWFSLAGNFHGGYLDSQITYEAGLYQPISGKGDYPMIFVQWAGAREYCEWQGGRLPTEAEWERAARGGVDGATYVWGNSNRPPAKTANVGDETAAKFWSKIFYKSTPAGVHWRKKIFAGYEDGYSATSPVCALGENGYGLCDMAGNVCEWVSDLYREDYFARSPELDPQGPAHSEYGEQHVVRGGSWYDDPIMLRVESRRAVGSPWRIEFDEEPPRPAILGFRCARDAK